MNVTIYPFNEADQPEYTLIYDIDEKYDETYKTTASAVKPPTTATAVLESADVDVYMRNAFHSYPTNPTQAAKCHKACRSTKRRSYCGICCCITSSLCGCFFLVPVILGIACYAVIVRNVHMISLATPIDFPIVTVSDQAHCYRFRSRITRRF